jgi:hypothetical protein
MGFGPDNIWCIPRVVNTCAANSLMAQAGNRWATLAIVVWRIEQRDRLARRQPE